MEYRIEEINLLADLLRNYRPPLAILPSKRSIFYICKSLEVGG